MLTRVIGHDTGRHSHRRTRVPNSRGFQQPTEPGERKNYIRRVKTAKTDTGDTVARAGSVAPQATCGGVECWLIWTAADLSCCASMSPTLGVPRSTFAAVTSPRAWRHGKVPLGA